MKNVYVVFFLLLWPSIAFCQNGISVRTSDLVAIAVLREIQYCGQVYPEYKGERVNYLTKLKKELPEMMQNNKYIEAVLADEILGSTADWNRPISRNECIDVIYGEHHLKRIKEYFSEEQAEIQNRKGRMENNAAQQGAPVDAPKAARH